MTRDHKYANIAPACYGQRQTMPDYRRLSTVLYRSLERLSFAIESCANIGFQESNPTTNAGDAAIWNDLNDAQKDAKLKLKHFRDSIRLLAESGK